MQNSHEIEATIWMLIDGKLDIKETAFIHNLIETDKEWRSTYDQLLLIHNEIHEAELDQPSLRFTKNVMEEIAKLQLNTVSKQYLNYRIIWGVGSFFLISILATLVFVLAQVRWSAEANSQATYGLDVLKADFSEPFNNTVTTVCIMFNIILGLLFIDQYLSSRKKKWKKSVD